MELKRSISPFGLLLAGIGGILGSGWLLGPLYAAQHAGPAAIIAWILGGLLMLVIAFSFAELGTTFPINGGMMYYAQHSHGNLFSFLIGLMLWISNIAIAPVETLAIVQYAANYLPGLVIIVDQIPILTKLGVVVASCIMLLMSFLNYYGARFFSKSNSMITIFKLVIPIATILVLIFSNFHLENILETQHGGFLPFGWHGVMSALPLGGVIYSFIGANTILQLAGETKRPQHGIPLALIGSMCFCVILYALLQLVFIGAIDPGLLKNGWKELHFTGELGPFAGILTAMGLSWFVYLIYTDALISPFGTGYVYTASTARVACSLSQMQFFPKFLQKLNNRGVPVRGLLFNYLIGLLLFLPFPAWQKLATFIISCFIVSYIVGPLALMPLRAKFIEIKRPFFLPYANTFALIGFYVCNLLIYWTGWNIVHKILILMGLGLIYYVGLNQKNRRSIILEIRQIMWFWIYLISMGFFSYFSSFGGGTGQLSFGIDFAVIALQTVGIYHLAMKSVQMRTTCNANMISIPYPD